MKAGSISVGDEVRLPEGRTSTITQIDTADGPADSAATGDSVTLLLADDIDLARGDIRWPAAPAAAREFDATVVGLTEKDIKPGQMLKLRYGSSLVKARVAAVTRTLDLDGVSDVEDPESVAMNDIAHITIQTQTELPSRTMRRGAEQLIDHPPATLAAGFGPPPAHHRACFSPRIIMMPDAEPRREIPNTVGPTTVKFTISRTTAATSAKAPNFC